MNGSTDTDTWSTKDMGLAALVALEQDVLGTEWDTSGSCYWFFEETPHVVDCVMTYSGNYVREISPRALIESYQLLNGALKRESRNRVRS